MQPQSTPGTSTSAGGAQASLSAEAIKSADARAEFKATEETDGFVMPSLETLVDGTDVAKKLSPEQLKKAYEAAEKADLQDPTKLLDFGVNVQKKASAVAREFIKEAKDVDFDAIAELAARMNVTMEGLKIGDLKPGVLSKMLSFLPGRQQEQVKLYLAKHQDLSDLMNTMEQAMSKERIKLMEDHQRLLEKVNENRGVYEEFSETIAVAELSHEANKKHVEKLKEQYKARQDEGKAYDISQFEHGLADQARSINDLKANRLETYTALRTMALQLRGIESQIKMIDNQVTFNRLVWDNSILMTAIDKRQENAVKAVEYNRTQIEKMIKERGGSIAQTLLAVMKEQGEGVVNAAVMEFAAAQTAKLNRDMIQAAKDNRERFKAAGELMLGADGLLRDTAAGIEKMTDDQLNEILTRAGSKKEG